MLWFYRLITGFIDGTASKHRKFIFTTLARLLAAACFLVAIIYCQKCTNQLNTQ